MHVLQYYFFHLVNLIECMSHSIIMDDFNSHVKGEDIGHDKLDAFCDTLNLTNLVKADTCYSNNHKSTTDLFLTNKPHSFQFTSVTETGLNG